MIQDTDKRGEDWSFIQEFAKVRFLSPKSRFLRKQNFGRCQTIINSSYWLNRKGGTGITNAHRDLGLAGRLHLHRKGFFSMPSDLAIPPTRNLCWHSYFDRPPLGQLYNFGTIQSEVATVVQVQNFPNDIFEIFAHILHHILPAIFPPIHSVKQHNIYQTGANP